jgi:hypothetical protein
MGQAKVRASMLEDRELLAQGKVLEDEIASAVESRAKGVEETEEDGSHYVMMLQVGRLRQWLSEGGEWNVGPALPPTARTVIAMEFWRGTTKIG